MQFSQGDVEMQHHSGLLVGLSQGYGEGEQRVPAGSTISPSRSNKGCCAVRAASPWWGRRDR